MTKVSDDKYTQLLMESIGHNVRMLRDATGMSQEAFGACVGMSRPTVARLESGRTVIDVEVACRIADFFGVKVDDLRQAQTERWAGLVVASNATVAAS